jgi:hypothetical protein
LGFFGLETKFFYAFYYHCVLLKGTPCLCFHGLKYVRPHNHPRNTVSIANQGHSWVLVAKARGSVQVSQLQHTPFLTIPAICTNFLLIQCHRNCESAFSKTFLSWKNLVKLCGFFFFFSGLELELRTLHLQSRCSISYYFPGLALNLDPPDFNLPRSYYYRHEPLAPGCKKFEFNESALSNQLNFGGSGKVKGDSEMSFLSAWEITILIEREPLSA